LQKRKVDYDVAVIDMAMPEMDGLMLAREITLRYTESKLRIFMMSSLVQRNDEELRANGISGYLTKPVKKMQLYGAILRMMSAQVERPRARTQKTEAS